MSMKPALRARIKADGAVAALAGPRVEWGKRRQGEPLPAVVLRVISDPRPQHLKGFQSLRETRVQADCMAETEKEAVDLAEAVIAAAAGPFEQDGVKFSRSGVDGPRDLSGQTDTGFVHRQVVDFLVRHRG